MSWTRLSDDFTDDCETLDDDAFRLHVEGLTWSNRKLLDCQIPKDHLRRFAKYPEAVNKLLAAGWWEDVGGYYRIRHHSVYQRTRAEVVAQQERNRLNGMKGGRPPGPPRERLPRKRSQNPDGLATGLATGKATGFQESRNADDKTQMGNPIANPQGQARRSRRGNHLLNGHEFGACERCEDAQALDNEAKPGVENPAWCGDCNFESADRRRRTREEPVL